MTLGTSNYWRFFLRILSVLCITAVGMFSLFALRSWIGGPHVSVSYPTAGTVVSKPLVTVQGNARFIARVYINGNLVPLTINDNSFMFTVVLPVGLSTVSVDGYTKNARLLRTTIPLYYLPEIPISENQY